MGQRSHGEGPVECQQAQNIESMGRELGFLNTVVWRDGKESMVSKMAVVGAKVNLLFWVAAASHGCL